MSETKPMIISVNGEKQQQEQVLKLTNVSTSISGEQSNIVNKTLTSKKKKKKAKKYVRTEGEEIMHQGALSINNALTLTKKTLSLFNFCLFDFLFINSL